MTDRWAKEYQATSGEHRSYVGSHLRFWGSNVLEELGLTLVLGIAISLVTWCGSSKMAVTDVLLDFPYLLLLAGGFVILMMVISCFKVYFPLLISMNVTRKAAMIGIWLSQAGEVLLLDGVTGLVWKVVPGVEAQARFALLPAFTGTLFGIIGICIIMGAVLLRWGRLGGIIIGVVCVVGGIGGGMAAALYADESFLEIQQLQSGALAGMGRMFLLVGGLLYVVSGVVSRVLTKKTEVCA